MMNNSQYWIDKLSLIKHPEGGYYREIYRSPGKINVTGSASADNEKKERDLASSIYFLLPSDDVSCFHRLTSDELWYFHAGSGLTIYIIDAHGALNQIGLGLDADQGELPQVLVPRGSIFGAMVNQTDSYTLIGCMVAPGFDFHDFELLERKTLLKNYPEHQAIIRRLTIE
jgi:predicted cupin superfamily sugar epimerase